MIHIDIPAAPFDPEGVARDFRALHAGDAGAVASFLGLVRGGEGERLELTHHPVLTARMIAAEARATADRFALLGLSITHRVGLMDPGEPIVLVLAAAAHRRAAFEAVDRMMDVLKSRTPFWKREHRPTGARWIEPTAADHAALTRWAEPRLELEGADRA